MSKARLLVVDDNPDDRELMQIRLSKLDYDVSVAVDGEKALAMISQESFDLVVLDFTMPGIDGLEVLRRLRTTRSTAELPVIMVTSSLDMAIQVQAVRLGANGYITKPVIIGVAQAQIDKHLRSKLAGAEATVAREDLAKTLADLQAAVVAAQQKLALLDVPTPSSRGS